MFLVSFRLSLSLSLLAGDGTVMTVDMALKVNSCPNLVLAEISVFLEMVSEIVEIVCVCIII